MVLEIDLLTPGISSSTCRSFFGLRTVNEQDPYCRDMLDVVIAAIDADKVQRRAEAEVKHVWNPPKSHPRSGSATPPPILMNEQKAHEQGKRRSPSRFSTPKRGLLHQLPMKLQSITAEMSMK
jgi:hypothetical protein